MGLSDLIGKALPHLIVKEISDVYLRKNFQALYDYFQSENQLLGFSFFDVSYAAATKNVKIAHGLNYIPADIVMTKLTGVGTVTFNNGLFDKINIDLTVDGACRIRFYAGTNWKTPGGPSTSTDTQQFSALAPIPASAQTPKTPPGVVVDFAGSTAPDGWLLCYGQLVSRITYADLFAAIGETYGAGNKQTTFGLPDLRGRVVAGKDDMGGTAASRLTAAGSGVDGKTINASGGAETVALSVAQIPSHGHQVLNAPSGTIGAIAACGGFAGVASAASLSYVNTGTSSAGNPLVQPTGSGAVHNNVQPTIILNKIMKT